MLKSNDQRGTVTLKCVAKNAAFLSSLSPRQAGLFIFVYVWLSCIAAAAAAKSLQSCLTLCDPMDSSLPGFSVHKILQARTLEGVPISFSNA